ncbi:hypothetical protein Moror_15389 [Moniliophthora roreri MCA 2997]|uniref:Uncharacterized protein n=1 Tax=Moniliophthora roreri (strain MCA 2997) TaxID=1381753 RepID=V2WN34_MONRO|nr:hypothetical protein Moror_15389 [Moniliophthora roreri MCA 2997]
MTDGPGEFWKNDKTDLLFAFDPEAEKVSSPAEASGPEDEGKSRRVHLPVFLSGQTDWIMTRPEGTPTNIKDWMNAAILFDESYK